MTASRRAADLDGINAAAQVVAAGGSAAALTEQVTRQLTRLLSLRSCSFQYGVAGIGLRDCRRDGSVAIGQRVWDADAEGFPSSFDTELLVESGGIFQGRFLMTPAAGARPTLEQRLLAVALADQVRAPRWPRATPLTRADGKLRLSQAWLEGARLRSARSGGFGGARGAPRGRRRPCDRHRTSHSRPPRPARARDARSPGLATSRSTSSADATSVPPQPRRQVSTPSRSAIARHATSNS